METLFIGALKKEKKNKDKEKDNQYKLKRPMAIAIGLIFATDRQTGGRTGAK